METKPLLYGLIGFFIGGLLVSSVAYTTTPTQTDANKDMGHTTDTLQTKTGDDFDAAYLQEMIAHHEGAVEMSQLAEKNAKHEELKTVARNIIRAQQSEINQFKEWQEAWNYPSSSTSSH